MVAQHPPPTTVGICFQGGAGANSHVTTSLDGQWQRQVGGGMKKRWPRDEGEGDSRDTSTPLLSCPHHPLHHALPPPSFRLCGVVVHLHLCPCWCHSLLSCSCLHCCLPCCVFIPSLLLLSSMPLLSVSVSSCPIVFAVVAPLLFCCCTLPVFATPVAHFHPMSWCS